MADVPAVLRALVDAAFRAGSITDAQHTELHGQIEDPPAEPQPEVPEAPAAPAFGQESNPYA